ncbi:MAG: septal ring lytic transglycosylase RlpA family protein [Gammaproteobacteria bacterium]|nr:septal ring lytic transglycosylase RlpA family protein [Gammaproteobacteria bacterium]
MINRHFAKGVPLFVALLIVGCSSPGPQLGRAVGDGPGSVIADPSAIPDAVPQIAARSRYGNPPEYEVFGKTYRVMDSAEGHRERGTASWYGKNFHGERTSSGEPYDMYAMTAAHKHLPLPTWVEVRHLETGQRIVVKVNDRGPFVGDRIIDLSYAAAAKLGMMERGTAPVEIRALSATASAGTPENPDGVYYLQLAAFGDARNATELQQQLIRAGLSAPAVVQSGDDGLHRVRLGPLHGVAAVDKVTTELAGSRFGMGHVIDSSESGTRP